MKRVLRGGLYPAFMGAALVAAWLGLESGASAGWVVGVVGLVGVGVTAVLERALPFEPRWNRPHGDRRADWGHALFSNLGLIELIRPTLLAALVTLGIAMRDAWGASLWPEALPLAVQVGFGLALGELSFYGFHRWMHEGWGRRFHVIHHSAERLYWLNSLRTHPFNTVGSFLSFQAPLALLGAGSDTMALVATFHAAHGLLQHGNLDLRLGPLNWLVSGPELHRWHHSREVAHANHNYGNNLAIWDVVFGTRHLPPGRPTHDVGIADLAFPTGWRAQLGVPLRWGARARAESSPTTPPQPDSA